MTESTKHQLDFVPVGWKMIGVYATRRELVIIKKVGTTRRWRTGTRRVVDRQARLMFKYLLSEIDER